MSIATSSRFLAKPHGSNGDPDCPRRVRHEPAVRGPDRPVVHAVIGTFRELPGAGGQGNPRMSLPQTRKPVEQTRWCRVEGRRSVDSVAETPVSPRWAVFPTP